MKKRVPRDALLSRLLCDLLEKRNGDGAAGGVGCQFCHQVERVHAQRELTDGADISGR